MDNQARHKAIKQALKALETYPHQDVVSRAIFELKKIDAMLQPVQKR